MSFGERGDKRTGKTGSTQRKFISQLEQIAFPVRMEDHLVGFEFLNRMDPQRCNENPCLRIMPDFRTSKPNES